jgi:hypothetical protein
MLQDAYLAGAEKAYARFGVKEALLSPGALSNIGRRAWNSVSSVPQLLFGSPLKTMQQGRRAFSRGGVLDPVAAFWPSVERGPAGERLPQAMGWLSRAGTAASGYGVYKAMKGEAGDPNEGRLSNTLGALGGAAGMGFGIPAVGALGAPLLARAGSSLGKGVGHILGSSPEPQQLDPLTYGQGAYQ